MREVSHRFENSLVRHYPYFYFGFFPHIGVMEQKTWAHQKNQWSKIIYQFIRLAWGILEYRHEKNLPFNRSGYGDCVGFGVYYVHTRSED